MVIHGLNIDLSLIHHRHTWLIPTFFRRRMTFWLHSLAEFVLKLVVTRIFELLLYYFFGEIIWHYVFYSIVKNQRLAPTFEQGRLLRAFFNRLEVVFLDLIFDVRITVQDLLIKRCLCAPAYFLVFHERFI